MIKRTGVGLKVGKGKVVKVVDFGAFVNFFGPRDGLVHISQLKQEKVGAVSDVLKEGDEVFVKLMGFDDRGKVRLSMKVVNQETGELIEGMEDASDDGGERRSRRPRKKADAD